MDIDFGCVICREKDSECQFGAGMYGFLIHVKCIPELIHMLKLVELEAKK